MKRTIGIFLGDGPQVGTLYYDVQGRRENAAFEYTAEWLAERGRHTLEPNLPLVAGPQFHKKTADGSVFPAVIADCEPDGWGRQVIRRDYAKRRQEAREAGEDVDAPALNALDFLLAVDDASRVGALRFQDEKGIFQRAPEQGRRTAPPLIELGTLLAASRAVETHSETAADLAYLRGRGTSLGGLRPKCSVIDDDGHLAIGKFPSVSDERAVTKGEVLALHLAKEAGITAADARLVDSNGSPVALVRRFDRVGDRRILFVSSATMMGVERRDGEYHSYTEIVDAIRIHCAHAQADIDELWRRIAFSVLITNIDDHLLNHGFLHESGELWRLSPAFDLNPSPERLREFKTWISEDAGPEARIDGLMSVTPYFRISRKRAKAILAEVERAVATWRETGLSIGMTEQELDQFADAFEHAERAAARRVIG
ncbi:MAG: type II toxin-antitoxin system HipA family toxin [Alphaproteobacteria bacterium]|nr:type II toxin-antitoxin system HipA family toxin [Alphaproteobacteria bacterium]